MDPDPGEVRASDERPLRLPPGDDAALAAAAAIAARDVPVHGLWDDAVEVEIRRRCDQARADADGSVTALNDILAETRKDAAFLRQTVGKILGVLRNYWHDANELRRRVENLANFRDEDHR